VIHGIDLTLNINMLLWPVEASSSGKCVRKNDASAGGSIRADL